MRAGATCHAHQNNTWGIFQCRRVRDSHNGQGCRSEHSRLQSEDKRRNPAICSGRWIFQQGRAPRLWTWWLSNFVLRLYLPVSPAFLLLQYMKIIAAPGVSPLAMFVGVCTASDLPLLGCHGVHASAVSLSESLEPPLRDLS